MENDLFFQCFASSSSSFRSSVFFVLYTVTTKRLCQFFELMKLCKQRRSAAACKVFLCIFLKSCRQCIRLVCLEIYRPFWGIGPKFLLLYGSVPDVSWHTVQKSGFALKLQWYWLRGSISSRFMLLRPTFGIVRSCSIFWSTAAIAARSTRPDSFAACIETETVRCSRSSCKSILLSDKIGIYNMEITFYRLSPRTCCREACSKAFAA